MLMEVHRRITVLAMLLLILLRHLSLTWLPPCAFLQPTCVQADRQDPPPTLNCGVTPSHRGRLRCVTDCLNFELQLHQIMLLIMSLEAPSCLGGFAQTEALVVVQATKAAVIQMEVALTLYGGYVGHWQHLQRRLAVRGLLACLTGLGETQRRCCQETS